MEVSFFATLRQVVGSKTVEFDLPPGATVRDLLAEMIRCYPGLKQELVDEHGNLYSHVHIFVNARDSTFLENGMETVIPPQARIGVFPAVGGG